MSSFTPVAAQKSAALLSYTHQFISVDDGAILYHGRWIHTKGLASTSFLGASLEFEVVNGTDIYLELLNTSRDRCTSFHLRNKPELLSSRPGRVACPVDLAIEIKEAQHLSIVEQGHGLVHILSGTTATKRSLVRATLISTKSVATTFSLRGIWISQYAGLRPSAPTELKYLEVLSPTQYAQSTNVSTIAEIWPSLLQKSIANATISTVSLDTRSCLTESCQNQHGSYPSIRSQYFRSGPPNTSHFNRPWSFLVEPTPRQFKISALILILGLADVEQLLDHIPTPSRRKIEIFMDDFTQAYSKLIQQIRRTALSNYNTLPSHDFRYEAFRSKDGTQIFHPTLDESLAYISGPSTIPIFLILPALPSQMAYKYSRQLRRMLHYATTAVLADLKLNIGDKRTYVVDTNAWLEDGDFDIPPTSVNGMGTRHFTLLPSGHIKFAFHLGQELCWWLGDNEYERRKCPFDRNDEYSGQLHVPETVTVNRILEEMKVTGVMEGLGMSSIGLGGM